MAQQQEAEQQGTQRTPQQLQVTQRASPSQPIYPPAPNFAWPTSKPGPRITPPPPGQKPMPGRTEQVVEVGYNQETGTPGTGSPLRASLDANLTSPPSFDQPAVTPQALKKRKK
jgi:hypothetical protein